MKLSKLSNQTNSQDPQAVNSRVFVGNLNTFQCSKTDVERMFQIYGRLAGISMHKGYAFVQFTNPFDARNACHGEDGRMVLSQTLDVNMVAEPKPHQVGRKRQNPTKTGNDWDYFYDSYCSSTLLRPSGIRAKKRKRLMTNTSRLLSDAVNSSNINAAVAAAALAQQQQQLHQQLQQQQQQQQPTTHLLPNPHHHHHGVQQQQQAQHQQQVAAVAMAAMTANLLPQQQLLLHHHQHQHQHSLLGNPPAAAACNGGAVTPTTTTHNNLSVFLQQHKQQQQQTVGQYKSTSTVGLQLNSSSVQNATSAIIAAANQTTLLNGCGAGGDGGGSGTGAGGNNEQMSTTATSYNSMVNGHQTQQQQQHGTFSAGALQPLTLSLPNMQHIQQQQHHKSTLLKKQIQLQHQQHQHQQLQQQEQLTSNQQWGPFKVYSNPDTLICGNCRQCFNELAELLDHKRSYCKLRFTCKCQDVAFAEKTPPASAKLLCAVCKDAFSNPWDLMVHAQAAHMVNIYELGNEANNNDCSAVESTDNISPFNNGNNINNVTTAITPETASTASIISNCLANNNNNMNDLSNEMQLSPPSLFKIELNNNNNNSVNDNKNFVNSNNNKYIKNNAAALANGNEMQMSPTTETMSTQPTPPASIANKLEANKNNGPASTIVVATSNGHVGSDADDCMDGKFGICNGLNGSVAEESIHHEGLPLEASNAILSQGANHRDYVKISNGSLSSRDSSPAE
ncbi:transcription factor mef2A [Eurosta solidaginis]|uniref:transcription factor mef2A n=1 Tax=Eurosta solidaginis TaxID=178769 RepID=UPI0035314942